MTCIKKVCLIVLAVFVSVPVVAQVTYKILPASTIAISGTSTLSDWVVKSQGVGGEMVFDPNKKGGGNSVPTGTIRNVKAVLEVSSIKSEKGETMDNKMYVALKSEDHPRITFLLTQSIEISKVPARVLAKGNVMLAGVTRPMTFELDLSYADNAFLVKGSQPLKLSDFEIEPPTAMFGQIETGDEIVLHLNLVFGR